VRTTFQYIDKLLSEAEYTMADAGSPSPFRRHSDDTTPIQRKVTHDYILRIREAMRRVMEELNIPAPEPHSGAVWAAAINLMHCSISLNGSVPGEAIEALREGDRVLERAQGQSFFLTRKIAKMHQAIIDIVAQRIAAALSNSAEADAASIFSETLTQMIAEPVAATLRCIEQTRDELTRAMQLVAATSGHGTPDELPRPAGLPMLDVQEISQRILIEKPRVLLLLGKRAVPANVQRQLERQYDRALFEFLSLCANRLRRWMEQSIAALRNAFNAFADMYRAHFDAVPVASGLSEESAIQDDLRILLEWDTANEPVMTSSM
ncbi:MAG TPA: hypothetical protein VN825_09805, partial [Candidatus Acidoferrum sp.]|nr:hypothetical protein [Candidatus Acidoferrum sp.]